MGFRESIVSQVSRQQVGREWELCGWVHRKQSSPLERSEEESGEQCHRNRMSGLLRGTSCQRDSQLRNI